MTTTLELGPDPEEMETQALELALERVEHAAPDEWLDRARRAVADVAATHETFIVDAVWEAGLEKPKEARAIGAVIRWAVTEGLIVGTDDFRPSAQAGCHKVPRRVWRSRVFGALE